MSALGACAALAVLELDATLVAQTLASRPLVAGAVAGALAGRAQTGALFGAAYELVGLCNLPVGGCLNWSGTVAAGTAVILSSGGAPFPLCFAAGLGTGALHARLESLERARRARSGDALAARAEQGGRALGAALGSSLMLHAAMTAVLLAAAVGLAGFASRSLWPAVPAFLRAGAAFAATSAPWIGLSSVAAWGLRRA